MKYFYNGILNDYMPFDTEGNGFFETIRVFKGKPVFLDDHVQRCKNAMSFFEIVSCALVSITNSRLSRSNRFLMVPTN